MQMPSVPPEARQRLAELGFKSGVNVAGLLGGIRREFIGKGLFLQGAEYFSKAVSKGDGFNVQLYAVVVEWASQNPSAALKWVTDQGNEPWADSAKAGYARSIKSTNRSGYEALLGKIRSEEVRKQLE